MDDACLVEVDGLVGDRVGEADGNTGKKVSYSAEFFCWDNGEAVLFRGVGDIDVGGGGGFGESVAFHGEVVEFFLKDACQFFGEFFSAGDDVEEGAELGGVDFPHVATKEGRG